MRGSGNPTIDVKDFLYFFDSRTIVLNDTEHDGGVQYE